MSPQDSTPGTSGLPNPPTFQLWSTTEAVVDSGALEALVNCLEEFDPSVKVAWEKPLEKVGAFDNLADLGWGNWGLLLWKPSSFFWFTWGAGKYGFDFKKEAVKKYCLGRKRKREVNSPRRAYATAQSSVNLLGVRFWQETGSFSEHFWYDICFERVWLTDHDDVMRCWSNERWG